MTKPRVVLVGAGHTHALLLKRWAVSPPEADVVLVADQPHSTYSGMVPGVIAGDYAPEASRIDAAGLAQRAGVRFVLATATRVDPQRHAIELEEGPPLAWDLASLDVGSASRGIDWPGVRKHTAAMRPIGELAATVDRRLGRLRAPNPRILVVGGGAAGVEIAFTLRSRLAGRGRAAHVTLVCGREGPLPQYPARARRLVAEEARSCGIEIVPLPEVRFADSEGVGFEGGHLDGDLVLWATGPAPPRLLAASPLPCDAHGFVRVRPTMEVVGTPGLFAVGDCATIDGAPWMPKSGVYAVRQAPVLDSNLRAWMLGKPLSSYHPQRHALSLLNLGGRRALAVKWDLAFAGHWPWRLKDRIDRSFLAGFEDAGTASATGGSAA